MATATIVLGGLWAVSVCSLDTSVRGADLGRPITTELPR
jgi:hypothetical protein